MKILTGRLRGQRILFKPNAHLRPTTDKARKAVFDMLQGTLEGRRALDLFAGTGALGFEALSQGAAQVTFVEQNREQCCKIEQNLERWGLAPSAKVLKQDVLEWLQRHGGHGGRFDLIFLDPPYAAGLAVRVLEKISETGALHPAGFVVMECRARDKVPARCGGLECVREKRYGQTQVLVYAASPGSPEGSR